MDYIYVSFYIYISFFSKKFRWEFTDCVSVIDLYHKIVFMNSGYKMEFENLGQRQIEKEFSLKK